MTDKFAQSMFKSHKFWWKGYAAGLESIRNMYCSNTITGRTSAYSYTYWINIVLVIEFAVSLAKYSYFFQLAIYDLVKFLSRPAPWGNSLL